MKIRFCHRQKFAYSPCFVQVLEAYLELIKAGHASHRIDIYNKSQVVYAVDQDAGDLVVGASLFMVSEDGEGQVNFSYVDASYRRQGIHAQIIKDVEQRLRKIGCSVMVSGIGVNNTAMLNAAVSAQRVPVITRHIKTL